MPATLCPVGATSLLSVPALPTTHLLITHHLSTPSAMTSPQPANTAAWLLQPNAPLAVQPAPYPTPGENELVVQNHAVAVNPLDWMKQAGGNFLFSWLKYPFVMGSDAAGEVVAVGAGVTRFRVGDRVAGHAVGMDKARNSSAEGAFQHYTVLLAHMTTPLPATLSYAQAAVLPLGLSTAACGLFEADQLALQLPTASPPQPTGKTLLVWGGSTSVGSNAIQLALAAGYEVVTTCSPHNFAYVKQLGARQAFDYNSPTIVADLVRALAGTLCAGALAIGDGAAPRCLQVLRHCQGDKVVSITSFPIDWARFRHGAPLLQFLRQLPRLIRFMVGLQLRSRLWGIRTNFVFGTTLAFNQVGPAIYVDFLPRALAEGRFTATPAPLVIGQGLGAIQAGLDAQRQGVSARKVVISLAAAATQPRA